MSAVPANKPHPDADGAAALDDGAPKPAAAALSDSSTAAQTPSPSPSPSPPQQQSSTPAPTPQATSSPASPPPDNAQHHPTQVVYDDPDFSRPPNLNYSLRVRKKNIAFFTTLVVLDCICMPIALYFGLWYGTSLSPNAGALPSPPPLGNLLTCPQSSV